MLSHSGFHSSREYAGIPKEVKLSTPLSDTPVYNTLYYLAVKPILLTLVSTFLSLIASLFRHQITPNLL